MAMENIVTRAVKKARRIIKKNVKKNPNSVKWGIIGTGYMAETFGTAIDGNPDGVVYAVASRTIEKAQKYAARHGNCIAYGKYEDMVVDANIDVIYIATPTINHYENIKMCLVSGKNVICEKPITSSASELNELKKLAMDNHCFLMEGMWMKCLPTYQKAVEWIEKGKIGKNDLIKADIYKREKVDLSKATYRKDMHGGVLQDYGIYAIAFPTGFMSDSLQVEGHGRKSAIGVDSDWSIYMTDGSVQAYINISSDFSGTSKAAVYGEIGSIEWNAPFNRTDTIVLYDKEGNEIERYSCDYGFEGFEYEIDEVQKCIRNGETESRIVPLESSHTVLKMVESLLDKMEK